MQDFEVARLPQLRQKQLVPAGSGDGLSVGNSSATAQWV
jgi:hypothetical protein